MTKRGIAFRREQHEARENRKNRISNENIAKFKGEAQIKAAAYKAVGNLAGQAVKSFGGIKGADIASGADNVVGPLAVRDNDPAWYKAYADLSKFTNVPTFFRLGMTDRAIGFNYEWNNNTLDVRGIPGIMIIPYVQMIGPRGVDYQDLASAPFNQILMRTKEQVLKSNSRSSVDWDAEDFGLFVCAVDSILSLIYEGERALYIAQTYKADNAYFCNRLLTALHWGVVEDLDLPDFRKKLELLKVRFNNSMPVPSTLNKFKRTIYLAGSVFADGEHGFNQIMAYRNDYRYVLGDNGVSLVCQPNYDIHDHWTLDRWYRTVGNMIQTITEDPTYSEMFQDLRNAFQGKILTLDTKVLESGVISINTHDEVRYQLQNTKMLPIYMYDTTVVRPVLNLAAFGINQSSENGWIYQGIYNSSTQKYDLPSVVYGFDDTGYGIFGTAPMVTFAKTTLAYDPTPMGAKSITGVLKFNSYNEDISSDEILVSTRNNLMIDTAEKDITTKTIKFTIRETMTELFLPGEIYGQPAGFRSFSSTVLSTVKLNDIAYMSAEPFIKYMSLLSSFDWHPICDFLFAGDNNMNYCYTIGDIGHAYQVSNVDVHNLNEICVMSLYFLEANTFKV